jgi:peptidyl-dipeptidase Dcp
MATDETVDINAEAVERETLDELGMPTCWDLILCVANSAHSFGGKYDAGLYSYLWSDMMAADVVESLAAAPLGLADSTFAQRWREAILTAGHLRPAGEAFRKLMSRDPDPVALLRRFALA